MEVLLYATDELVEEKPAEAGTMAQFWGVISAETGEDMHKNAIKSREEWNRYLMDTNAVIDFLIGKLPAAAKEKILGIEPAISVITYIELFSSNKISDQELLQLQAFVKIATVFNIIDQGIVLQAINIRKTNKTKTPDAIIAATALAYNLILITRNTKDFLGIPKLQLFNPWEVQ